MKKLCDAKKWNREDECCPHRCGERFGHMGQHKCRFITCDITWKQKEKRNGNNSSE